MNNRTAPITKAVILAGGLGARLRPLTNIIPKPLLPIGNSTILEIQICALRKHGVSEIYIATNYMHDQLVETLGQGEALGVRVKFSREEKPLGTCGPLTLLANELDRPFFVLNGDILTAADFRGLGEFALRSEAELTVVTKEINIPFRFGRVITEGHYIVDVEEKPTYKQEVLAGIYVILPELLESIPRDTYFGMDNLIKQMLAMKRPVAKYLMSEYWVDIGQLDDYAMARELFAAKGDSTLPTELGSGLVPS